MRVQVQVQVRVAQIARPSARRCRIAQRLRRSGLVPGMVPSVPQAARHSSQRPAVPTTRSSVRRLQIGREPQRNALAAAHSSLRQALSVHQAVAAPLPNAPQAGRNTMHSKVWIPAGSRSTAGARAALRQPALAGAGTRRVAALPALPVAVAVVVLGLAVAVVAVLGPAVAVADAGVRPSDSNDRRLTTF